MKGIIDVHCHIVPGVDDGPKTLEESIKMLELQYQEGVRTIFATPHFRHQMFECDMDKINVQFQALKTAARDIGDDGMEVYLGCEHHAHLGMVEELLQKQRPTMGGSDHVLVEFSEHTSFQSMRERLYDLTAHGFSPIIAHAERYQCLTEKNDYIAELIQLGAEIQINASSVTGADGRRIKKFCRELMKKNQLHYIGTDGHGMEYRPPHMAACAKYIEKKMGERYARKIMIENPAQIIK